MSIKTFFVLFCCVFIQLFANSELVHINEDSTTDDLCPSGFHYSNGRCVRDNPENLNRYRNSQAVDRLPEDFCEELVNSTGVCSFPCEYDENGICQTLFKRNICPPGSIPDGFGNCINKKNGKKLAIMRCRPGEINLGNGICVNTKTGKASLARKECPPGQEADDFDLCDYDIGYDDRQVSNNRCPPGQVPDDRGNCVKKLDGTKVQYVLCILGEVYIGNGKCFNRRTKRISAARRKCPMGQIPDGMGNCVDVPGSLPDRKWEHGLVGRQCHGNQILVNNVCVTIPVSWRPGK